MPAGQEFSDGPPFLQPAALQELERLEGGPYLVRRGGGASAVGGAALQAEWKRKQDMLIKWTRDPANFNEADVRQNFELYRAYFEPRPHLLAGNVVDVGGGWGLFRKFWREGGCYTVHDPGVERFTVAPPATLQRHFGDGLAKAAWFVEGVGETLPYRDCCYDVVMIASALDHVADPARVLAEAHRVLRPGGRLLVIQGFDPEPGAPTPPGRSFGARLLNLLRDPRRLHRALRMRLFHRGEHHMHHFTRDSLRAQIAAPGFRDITETVISDRFGVMGIEAVR